MTELEASVEQLPEELHPCVRKRDDGAVEIELDRSMISGPVGFYVGMGIGVLGCVGTGLLFLAVLVGLMRGESDVGIVPVVATGVVFAGFAFLIWYVWRRFHTTETVAISSDHVRVFTTRGDRQETRLECHISDVEEVGLHRGRRENYSYMTHPYRRRM
jgi:hypothetical protein